MKGVESNGELSLRGRVARNERNEAHGQTTRTQPPSSIHFTSQTLPSSPSSPLLTPQHYNNQPPLRRSWLGPPVNRITPWKTNQFLESTGRNPREPPRRWELNLTSPFARNTWNVSREGVRFICDECNPVQGRGSDKMILLNNVGRWVMMMK